MLLAAGFQGVRNKGCHFHLAQSIYRRVQMSGLSSRYGNDENFSLLIRHIPALAFLPPDDISAAFNQLKNNIPVEANGQYSGLKITMYGRIRRVLKDGNVVRTHHYFRPSSGQSLIISIMHFLELKIP